MNKKKIFILLGIIMILSVAISNVAFSKGPYLDEEFVVQKSVINTFDLKDNDLKPLFMRDIYDDTIAKESPETRVKVAEAIYMLKQDNELSIGDFKPMIFLKGKDKILIGVKHPDNNITLTEFDLSKEKPVMGNKQVKEAK